MKTEIRYKWRTLWAGKWGTTRYYATEEAIRKTNPEAVRIDGDRLEVHLPETEEEHRRAQISAEAPYSRKAKPVSYPPSHEASSTGGANQSGASDPYRDPER